MRVLAIDIGSSSVKAGVWVGQQGGRFVSRSRIPVKTHFDGGAVEVAPKQLLRALEHAGEQALAHHTKSIDAIAFCTFSSGVVVTDQSGEKVKAGIITHADRRSVREARDLVARTGKKWWLTRTGNLPYPGGIGSSTLAWLGRHRPAVFRGQYRIGQVSSFIGRHLTGEWTTDPSQAVFLGLYDIHRGQWSEEICSAVGVDISSLPRLKAADEVMGGLTPRLARRWKISAGIPVVGGFVDTSAAVIQTPMSPGQLAHNAGSTDVLAMCLDQPHPAEGILTRPVGVGRMYPPRWLAVRTIASSGSAVNWMRQTLFADLSESAWNRTIRHACMAAREPGEVVCLPDFAGQRAAIEQGRGAEFRGLHLSTTRTDMLTALIRGLIAESTHSYELLHALHPPQRTVYSMGGAAELGDAMHRAWPGKHTFRQLPGDSLAGLAQLGATVLGSNAF